MCVDFLFFTELKKKLAFYFSGPKNSVAEHFWFALLPRKWHMEGRGNHDDDGTGCFFLFQNTEHSRRFLRYFFQQDPLHPTKKNLRLRNPNHTICSLYPPRGTLPAGDTLAASARNQQHTRSIIGSTNWKHFPNCHLNSSTAASAMGSTTGEIKKNTPC